MSAVAIVRSFHAPIRNDVTRAGVDNSMAGYRTACVAQLLDRFASTLGADLDDETTELLDESRELLAELSAIYPDEWPAGNVDMASAASSPALPFLPPAQLADDTTALVMLAADWSEANSFGALAVVEIDLALREVRAGMLTARRRA